MAGLLQKTSGLTLLQLCDKHYPGQHNLYSRKSGIITLEFPDIMDSLNRVFSLHPEQTFNIYEILSPYSYPLANADPLSNIKAQETIIKNLAEIGKNQPVEALRIALICDRYMENFDLHSRVISGCAEKIPEDDVKLLRYTAAYFAAHVLYEFVVIGVGKFEDEIRLTESLASMFDKLSKIPVQAIQVKELADDFTVKFTDEYGRMPGLCAVIEPLVKFTTSGVLFSARRLPSGGKLSLEARVCN